jgi:coenzyme F420-0:L-glutamate ligase / coenzyme F420-1:gamma-L-glutamate ligase
MQGEIRIIPIHYIPEIKKGDNLANLLLAALKKQKVTIDKSDIIVITQKIVSKSEGRIIDLSMVTPSQFATQIGKKYKKDPRYVELVFQESKNIVRMSRGVIIAETHHGFICANAGVDASNVGKKNSAALLPKDPDTSAKKIREDLEKDVQGNVGVIISDTWGRAWREGQVNFAIGASGLEVLTDYKGVKDANDYELKVSIIAVADELASAAELVMGKVDKIPAVIIKGYPFKRSENGSKALLRTPKKDLFR